MPKRFQKARSRTQALHRRLFAIYGRLLYNPDEIEPWELTEVAYAVAEAANVIDELLITLKENDIAVPWPGRGEWEPDEVMNKTRKFNE